MPSVSAKQAHLFAAVAHGWQPPGRHIDVGVAREFHDADKKAGVFEHKQRQSTDHHNKYP
jgi:hypothetical protein